MRNKRLVTCCVFLCLSVWAQAGRAADWAPKLDQAMALLQQDKWGEGTQAIDAIEALVTAGLDSAQREALEGALLAHLARSDASFRAQHVALSALSMMGTERSIPQLQILLAYINVSNEDEAITLIRDSLDKSQWLDAAEEWRRIQESGEA